MSTIFCSAIVVVLTEDGLAILSVSVLKSKGMQLFGDMVNLGWQCGEYFHGLAAQLGFEGFEPKRIKKGNQGVGDDLLRMHFSAGVVV